MSVIGSRRCSGVFDRLGVRHGGVWCYLSLRHCNQRCDAKSETEKLMLHRRLLLCVECMSFVKYAPANSIVSEVVAPRSFGP